MVREKLSREPSSRGAKSRAASNPDGPEHDRSSRDRAEPTELGKGAPRRGAPRQASTAPTEWVERIAQTRGADAALEALLRLRRLFPGDLPLLRLEAWLLCELGRDEEAGEAYRRLIALAPRDREVALDEVDWLLSTDRLEAASMRLEMFDRRFEPCSRSRAMAGHLAWRGGRMTEAEALLKEALAIGAVPSWTARTLADVLEARGARSEMLEVLEAQVARHAELDGRAAAAVRRGSLRHGGTGPGGGAGCWRGAGGEVARALDHGYLGAAYRAAGDWGRAEQAFRRALELHPGYGWAARELIDIQCDRGELDEALRLVHRLLDEDPLDPHSLGYLGEVLRLRGDVAGAVQAFEMALWIYPGYSWAARQLSGIRTARGDLKGARAVLLATLAVGPDDPWTLLALGRVCRSLGLRAEARSALARAAALAEDGHELRAGLEAELRERRRGPRRGARRAGRQG